MTVRTESGPPITELFGLLSEYILWTGASSIKDWPGCWEHAIGEHWWCAANGHQEPVVCSRDYEVPPFHLALFRERSAWPTAIIGPYAGAVIGAHNAQAIIGAHNAQAIEDELIAVVKAALR